jgi:hypothetical protein
VRCVMLCMLEVLGVPDGACCELAWMLEAMEVVLSVRSAESVLHLLSYWG